jgi:osmoprotectant transport system permease protein
MRRWLVLSLFLLASVGVTVWVTGMDRIGVMTPFTYEEIFLEIRVHLLDLVFPSVLIATVIAVLVGILITRTGFKRLGSPIMAVASAAMSIPSMGVLAIMVPVLIALGLPGYGILPALVALVTWGVLPILRNTYAGINNISPGILEAARGMGMTRGQIARRIELPLALPVIMAGIRVTTVILVGTAALAVIVGAGGLGRIILAGVNNRVPLITLQGAAPVAAIAIILSPILAYVERRLTPRGMRIETAF